jgi:hypothetical protein
MEVARPARPAPGNSGGSSCAWGDRVAAALRGGGSLGFGPVGFVRYTGQSLMRSHHFCSQRSCSFGIDLRFNTPALPNALSGHK